MCSEPDAQFTRPGVPSITSGGRPTPRRVTLLTDDGVRIEAAYEPRVAPATGSTEGSGARQDDLVIVIAHGFTGSLDRPAVRRVAWEFARYAAVITFSFRGHGRSGGRSTVGDREVLDLAAAVRWARSLGHARVATVGFSMGGSVAIRHAALSRPAHRGRTEARAASTYPLGSPGADAPPGVPHAAGRGACPHTDAVVAVSAPARWYYRGTAPMRRLHWMISRPAGRLVVRYGLRTRIHPKDWDPVPLSPVEAVPLIAPTPLLIVHGDRDGYFPLDHPQSLADASGGAAELWIEHGLGHAENAAEPELLHRIGDWLSSALPLRTG
ncbi:alpha/beta hydrolase [Streptomyces sp. KR80]|uniref:alpha/beta hydrolase n=1 Tax=Streptomyces sp. KR80 TaxID=3457426 RepID=UPI003FD22AA8